jgi:hypothetical protein
MSDRTIPMCWSVSFRDRFITPTKSAMEIMGLGSSTASEYKSGIGTYFGERQLIVKLIPVASVPLLVASDGGNNNILWPMLEIDAAERPFMAPWKAPEPVKGEYLYVLTTPRARLLPDDKVMGCKITEDNQQINPTISWVGQHADMPLERLTDTDVDEQAVQAILAASH